MKMNSFKFGFFYPVYRICGQFNPKCGSPMVPVCATAPQRRRSSSLQLAKKEQHDTTRMAAFMNKKDAQNLPFYNLENNELQDLGFNSLLRIKTCQQNCKKTLADLENKVNSQSNCISFLEIENADLKVSTNIQKEKCLNLSKEIDRIKEKSKKQIDSQKAKIAELEIQCMRKTEHIKPVSSYTDDLITQCELRRLKSLNMSLEQKVNTLTNEIKQLGVSKQKLMDSAKADIKCLTDNFFGKAKRSPKEPSANKSCQNCGTTESYPEEFCPAKLVNARCGCCQKSGHFTLMCRHLDKYV